MGYTHYWYKEKEIDEKTYSRIVHDFGRTLGELRKHIDLADANGAGSPWISAATGQVHFNGREKCGHKEHELHITWPAKGAGGIARDGEDVKAGSWFAGAQLSKRACGGDCSHESFIFDRVREVQADWDKPDEETGLWFDFCKTAFKPYDLAVITFLIIAKRHLGAKIIVASDGEDEHWFDGKMLCQTVLGYGLDFAIDKEGHLQEPAGKAGRA